MSPSTSARLRSTTRAQPGTSLHFQAPLDGRTSTAISASEPSSADSGHESCDDNAYVPSRRSLQACAQRFHDRAQLVGDQIDVLKETYDSILALASRLVILHPNSIETPTLALDLRDSLVQAARALKGVDSDLFDLWQSEERVRTACARDVFSIDGLRGAPLNLEVERRQREVEALVKRFKRRCKDIRRESRWEKDERRDLGEDRREPVGVDDYLARGSDCPDLTRTDLIHASRWLVSNPFTVLSKLLDNLQALRIPEMVANDRTPSTFIIPASTLLQRPLRHGRLESIPLLPDSPTPAGTVDRTRPLASWKSEILHNRPDKATPLHDVFDKASERIHDWSSLSDPANRAKKEKWIILASLMLLPVVLLAVLVEKLIDGRSSASSVASQVDASTGSLTSLFPTMINQDGARSQSTGAVGVPFETMGLRRRDSFKDAVLV
ncbi:hypothetical protein JCM11491_002725 [Sporobolomyces phaffii]